MAPPTREQSEQAYRDLIDLRRKQNCYKVQMDSSRTTPKFLEELWEYVKQVEDAVEEYKVIMRNCQIAIHDIFLQAQVSTQYDEISDFYEGAIVYVDAAEEANEEERRKSFAPKAKTSEPERNAAMFKPCTLLHNSSINEFRQWEKRFGAYYQQYHIHANNLTMQRSFLI